MTEQEIEAVAEDLIEELRDRTMLPMSQEDALAVVEQVGEECDSMAAALKEDIARLR